MPGAWSQVWAGLLAITLLFALPAVSLAEDSEEKKEEEEKRTGDGYLDEEFSTLEDADFPDLVAADEESDLMDELAFLEESAVVESAARHRQEIGMSPSAITVITREDIETSGAATIPDLLRMVPGMDVVVASPFLTSITSRLYWTYENNHYLVLLDGREANIELLGQPFWEALPILLEDIERIEIIRGPGSSLYGANALAGVVSVTTRAVPDKTSGWARVVGGEAGMFAASARVSTVIGDWGFSLGGGGDFLGTFSDPRIPGKRVWKLRSVVEYRRSGSERFLLDASVSRARGPVPTAIGELGGSTTITTLQLAYRSEDLRGRLYWSRVPMEVEIRAPLDYQGIRLARIRTFELDSHMIDGDVQWTLPTLWKPLMVIVGGGGRVCWLGSDRLLDGETYADLTSPRYRETGISHWEGRGGAFVHGELSPTDWVTLTGGVRLDYNTETGEFVSPRLAAVFRPAERQFLRLGVARAFRKPAFMETNIHPMAEFPDDSPITGGDRDKFQEFMTRVLGNDDLENEELLSFETGYLGQFLDNRLFVSLDLYFNLHTNIVGFYSNIVPGEQGLPDLENSSFMFANEAPDLGIIGSEFCVRFAPSKYVSLLASWSHRALFQLESGEFSNKSPKNLITVGGRLRTPSGFTGSLYVFSRSEFLDTEVDNPAGLLEPMQEKHMDNVFLVLGKLGWRWGSRDNLEIEAGVNLFLPVSPFSAPHFRYYEKGGGITPAGKRYGGDELCRVVSGYIQGSF